MASGAGGKTQMWYVQMNGARKALLTLGVGQTDCESSPRADARAAP
jgi:Tol biopolymer transport system component